NLHRLDGAGRRAHAPGRIPDVRHADLHGAESHLHLVGGPAVLLPPAPRDGHHRGVSRPRNVSSEQDAEPVVSRRALMSNFEVPAHRNFAGYGAHPPHAQWPDGARGAVSLVLNVEEGAEQAVRRGDAVNEHVYDMIDVITGGPNPTMESHFDYGPRAGYWRIAGVLERYGATCTVNACAEALALSPWLGRDAVARGFEISSHGYRWLSSKGMSETEEREWIRLAVKTTADACGVRPVGWHTRCPHTPNTRRLLIEEGGFLYDSDAYDDDLPYLLEVAGGGHHVVLA